MTNTRNADGKDTARMSEKSLMDALRIYELIEAGLAKEQIERALAAAKAQKEEKEEKKAARMKARVEYDSTHLYVSYRGVNKAGKAYTRRAVASGTFTDKGIVLNMDANAYVVLVDDGQGGVFIRSYARCKASAGAFYFKDARVKACEELNKSDAIAMIAAMPFSVLMDKVKGCKGFRPCTVKRALECIDLAAAKASKVARDKAARATV